MTPQASSSIHPMLRRIGDAFAPGRFAAPPFRRVALLTAIALLACALCGFAGAPDEAPFAPPLAHPPLAPPLTVTGGFGEFRIGHFHAGLDFGTGQKVGRPVLACGDGTVERVRASGVGYGRSIYLRLDDGRLIQYGHLDAYVEPLAAYVRAKQDSSGQYEQDLWPEAGRFRFRAGDPIAWSGESGAGGPHLHFEIRRGDMAYHPMRAGLVVTDSTPPSLASLTLEPMDDTSAVERSGAPFTRVLGEGADTLRVRGRVRAIVGARDGVWRGVDRMVPWSVAMEWAGHTTECRFDSVSWATDMVEGEYVYDAGRVTGDKGLVLWAPAGFRPRFLRTDVPLDQDAGTIVVRPGDAPRPLRLIARDLGGQRAERNVVLVPGLRPDTAAVAPQPAGPGGLLQFTALPGGWMRVTEPGAPAGTTRLTMTPMSRPRVYTARPSARGWSTVVQLDAGRRGFWSEEFHVSARTGDPKGWHRSQMGIDTGVDPRDSCIIRHGDQYLSFPAGAVFEPTVALFYLSTPASATAELEPAGIVMGVGPGTLPLRKPVRLSLWWKDSPRRGLGMYREGDDGWEWVDAWFDSIGHHAIGESRRLGRFTLFRDKLAPRVTLRPAARRAAPGPYNRWALEATIAEDGSGLDGRASYVEVDGRRRPTEWDSEQRTLRWRPARPPAKGRHAWRVIATDRAGNVSRTAGTFVLD